MKRLLLLLCLCAAQNAFGALAVVGNSTLNAVQVDSTPTLPTNVANDIILLFVQSANQAISAPSGYAEVGTQLGTGSGAGSVKFAVFWKRSNGSESNPTVTDTGDHTHAMAVVVRGAITTGTPFESDTTALQTTAGTSLSWQSAGISYGSGGSSVTTTVDGALVFLAVGHAQDANSVMGSSEACATLNNVTEEVDASSLVGTGGGFFVTSGIKAHAGNVINSSTNNFTATMAASSAYVITAFAMKPVPGVPAFIGTGTPATGQNALTTVTLPIGHVANDILMMVIQSSNQTIATPSGWTEITDIQAGSQTGTAAAAGSMRIAVFWKRDGGSETDPSSIADSGDHTTAIVLGFSGCITTGNPFDVETVGLQTTTATAVSWQSSGITYGSNGGTVTTTVNNATVLQIVGHAIDLTLPAAGNVTGFTCAQLTSEFRLNGTDFGGASGTGGGFSVGSGNMLIAGAVVASSLLNFTATMGTTSKYAVAFISLIPAATANNTDDFFLLFP